MKKTLIITIAALLLVACASNEEKLKQRAEELCRYIPDHELLEQSKVYMTADFYAVLDTMFNRLPEHEAMDHEWLYYFVTGNGGTYVAILLQVRIVHHIPQLAQRLFRFAEFFVSRCQIHLLNEHVPQLIMITIYSEGLFMMLNFHYILDRIYYKYGIKKRKLLYG